LAFLAPVANVIDTDEHYVHVFLMASIAYDQLPEPLVDDIICDRPFLHLVADVVNTLLASTVIAIAWTRYHGQIFPSTALCGVRLFFGELTIIHIFIQSH
jgi:hypothetical protein